MTKLEQEIIRSQLADLDEAIKAVMYCRSAIGSLIKKDNEKRFSRGNIAQQISWDRRRCKPGDFSKVACLECGWNTQFDDEMKLFCTQSDCVWTEK